MKYVKHDGCDKEYTTKANEQIIKYSSTTNCGECRRDIQEKRGAEKKHLLTDTNHETRRRYYGKGAGQWSDI